MHLARLCQKPILIWADGQSRINGALGWNVFNVPIFVVSNDTFRPSPAVVKANIDEAFGRKP